MGAIYTNGEFYGGGFSHSGGGSGEDYVLPPATSETLGGVQIGDGLNITRSGILSTTKKPSNIFNIEDFNVSEQNEVSLKNIQRRIELTQAQYDALSENEKNNGTMYLITDGEPNNSANNSKNITYSTELVKTNNVWIDGRDIYRKVCVMDFPENLGNYTYYDFWTSVPSLETVISVKGTIKCADNFFRPLSEHWFDSNYTLLSTSWNYNPVAKVMAIVVERYQNAQKPISAFVIVECTLADNEV